MDDMDVRVDDQGRTEPPLAASEIETLLGFLDYQRATFEWKCRGLDSHRLAATVGASTMTLGGLQKHLASAETMWFSRFLHDDPWLPPFDTADWDSSPDWDFDSAAHDSPTELLAIWTAAVERSRAAVARALATGGLDQPTTRSWPDGHSPSLRWVVVHMIEEYARHNGHADLLRESIDGETGE